jgi:hypothetical protein
MLRLHASVLSALHQQLHESVQFSLCPFDQVCHSSLEQKIEDLPDLGISGRLFSRHGLISVVERHQPPVERAGEGTKLSEGLVVAEALCANAVRSTPSQVLLQEILVTVTANLVTL